MFLPREGLLLEIESLEWVARHTPYGGLPSALHADVLYYSPEEQDDRKQEMLATAQESGLFIGEGVNPAALPMLRSLLSPKEWYEGHYFPKADEPNVHTFVGCNGEAVLAKATDGQVRLWNVDRDELATVIFRAQPGWRAARTRRMAVHADDAKESLFDKNTQVHHDYVEIMSFYEADYFGSAELTGAYVNSAGVLRKSDRTVKLRYTANGTVAMYSLGGTLHFGPGDAATVTGWLAV